MYLHLMGGCYRRTNKDGRLGDLIPQAEFTVGTYKLRFLVKDYYDQHSIATFYPFADVSSTDNFRLML